MKGEKQLFMQVWNGGRTMKPINEMTMTECLDVLRGAIAIDPNNPDWVTMSRDLTSILADRIHELTRWIPVSERMPTEDAASPLGDSMGIEFWSNKFGGMKYFCTIERFTQGKESFIESNHITDWRRIDKPEGV